MSRVAGFDDIPAAIADLGIHRTVFFPLVSAGIIGCGIQALVFPRALVQPDGMEVSLVVGGQINEGMISVRADVGWVSRVLPGFSAIE